jgi:hypothetical protein
MPTITCTKCQTTTDAKETKGGNARLPKGRDGSWRRHNDAIWCPTCWKEAFVLRAVTFPVVKPLNGTWDEFGEACRNSWTASTALANWAVSTLYENDVRRKPADTKLKPMPSIYLYGLASKKFWGWKDWQMCYSSAQSLLQAVQSKYAKTRIDLLWRNSVSVPNHTYPFPYPVHNDCWTARLENGSPVVEINMAGKSWVIALKSGKEFVRQLSALKLIVDRQVKQGELSLYRQGFREKHTMVKLVGWFPKSAKKSGHTILVRTDPNALWVCEREGRREWILNADDVKRRIESHRCFLQRIHEDVKMERRSGQKPNRNIDKARKLRCEKQEDYIDTKTHQFSAYLVNFCSRQGAAVVIYDDQDQSYLPQFPWFGLRTKLAYKLEATGIELIHRGLAEEVA